MMITETLDLQYRFFVVGKRPLCLWDTNIGQKNLKFLNSIDPSYFEYLCHLYSHSLNNQDEPTNREAQHAALALRTAYSQALETLFALIFAAIQAPYCVPAWINAYTNRELLDLVEKVQEEKQVTSVLDTETPSWSDIYDLLFSATNAKDKAYESSLKDGFIQTWKYFAHDFMDRSSIREYNSIKHGLRVSLGGFKLKLHTGVLEEPVVPPPQDKMIEVTNSDFGSSYFNSEKIEACHLRLKGELRNWNLESLAWGLQLAAMSIANVQSALKTRETGSPFPFKGPEDLSDFGKWGGLVSLIETDVVILPESIHSFTEKEILSNYKAKRYGGIQGKFLRIPDK